MRAIACNAGSDAGEFRPTILTEHDKFEVETFSRFLKVMGTAPDKVAYTPKGWIAYVIGDFFYGGTANLSPPPGYDDVPITAWTFPG